MSRLFKRSWKVTLDSIQFTELDVSFEVEKSLKPDPNKCVIRVWNLTETHRKSLEALSVKTKAPTAGAVPGASQPKGRIPVELVAGYKDATSLIFRGDLRRAATVRDGADLITQLEGEDGGRSVLWSRVSQSFPPGTSGVAVVKACAQALGVGTGNLDDVAKTKSFSFDDGTVLTGSAAKELATVLKSMGLSYSIQNGVLQVLERGKAIQATAVKLGPSTGLVGRPEVNADGTVSATVLMVPDVYPGRLVQFDTVDVSGFFRVDRTKYVGDTHGDQWYIQMETAPLKA